MSKRTRATTRSRRPTKRAVEPGTRASPAVSLLRKQGWVRVWQGALSGTSPPLKASLTPEHPEWAETGPPVTSRHPGPGSALSRSAQRRPAERPCSAQAPMGSGRAPPGVLQLSHQPMAYPWSASAPNLGAFKDSHGKSLQASWGCCSRRHRLCTAQLQGTPPTHTHTGIESRAPRSQVSTRQIQSETPADPEPPVPALLPPASSSPLPCLLANFKID